MRSKTNGHEFVAKVSDSLGEKLKFGEWVELLYDVLETNHGSRVFEKLSFEAKSYNRLARLFASGISNDSVKEKVGIEIQSALKRFAELLEQASDNLERRDRERFRKQFFEPTTEAFENITKLLDDFSKIKDFLLKERDEIGKS